jgi:hypothetical protein
MAFKIKNVTNLLDKRHPFVNTSVEIEYVDKNSKSNIKLKVGEELIFDSITLPTSIHNLRIKKFIRVIQISNDQVAGMVNPQEPEVLIIDLPSQEAVEDSKSSKYSKKK